MAGSQLSCCTGWAGGLPKETLPQGPPPRAGTKPGSSARGAEVDREPKKSRTSAHHSSIKRMQKLWRHKITNIQNISFKGKEAEHLKRHFTKEKQDDQQGHRNMLPSSLTRRTAIRNTKRRGYIPNTKSNSKKKPKSQRVPWGPSGQGPGLSLPCCCSGAQSCPTFRDPTDYSTPGLPVLHRLQEFAQTHVHCVSDANQPSHPLSHLSLASNLSWHQGLFQ